MCLEVHGIQCGAIPVDVTSGVGFRLQRLKDALPRAVAPPPYEADVSGPFPSRWAQPKTRLQRDCQPAGREIKRERKST